MDKEKAHVKILDLFWGKEEKSPEYIREELMKTLEQLENYSYRWGRRQGMFKIATIVEELAEKEKV